MAQEVHSLPEASADMEGPGVKLIRTQKNVGLRTATAQEGTLGSSTTGITKGHRSFLMGQCLPGFKHCRSQGRRKMSRAPSTHLSRVSCAEQSPGLEASLRGWPDSAYSCHSSGFVCWLAFQPGFHGFNSRIFFYPFRNFLGSSKT